MYEQSNQFVESSKIINDCTSKYLSKRVVRNIMSWKLLPPKPYRLIRVKFTYILITQIAGES